MARDCRDNYMQQTAKIGPVLSIFTDQEYSVS